MSHLRKMLTAIVAVFSLSAMAVAAVNPSTALVADSPTTRTYSAESFVAASGGMLVFQTPRGFDFVPLSELSLSGSAIAVKHVDLVTVMPKFLGQPVSLVTGHLSDHGSLLLATSSSLDEARTSTATAVSDQKFSTTYTDKNGFTHTVETPRRPQEGVPAWVGRHQAALEAFRAAFPPT